MAAMLGLVVLLAAAAASPLFEEDTPLHRSSLATKVDDTLNYRLPMHIAPTLYNITITPYLTEGAFTFDGMIRIHFTVKEATNKIVLHAKNLEIDPLKMKLQFFSGIPIETIANATEDAVMDFFTITLSAPLEPSMEFEPYFLTMAYTGVLDDDMKGFYRSSYIASDGSRRWIATTQLQATEARRAFPCFDEPHLKAVFEIQICREEHMHSISNMPQMGDGVPSGTLFCDKFEKSPPMSTYLVAFVVSDFAVKENADKKFRIFAQPPMIDQAVYSFGISPSILDYLALFLEYPYTLPKIDEIAIPDFDAGAMENWGLVAYRERLLLFEEGVSTSENKQRIATVIAHEYAHQWFGNLVTPEWWRDIWLNEGFATYFESFATAKIEKTWRLEEQFVVRDLQSSMVADARPTSHPMSHDVCSPMSINAVFDTINYEKAGSVIRMMEHMVTPSTFQRGLTRYIIARAYGVATPIDLFRAMDAQYVADFPTGNLPYIPKVMDTWVTQMGYPIINVIRDYASSTAEVTQERFLLTSAANSDDTHDYLWHIPLTYTTEKALNFSAMQPQIWLEANHIPVTINFPFSANDWILFNIQETGYYRVNYDLQNWKSLSRYLNSYAFKAIHALNRAQLIDDSFSIARANLRPYEVPLELSRYLVQEVDYVPWYSAFRALNFIDSQLNQIGGDYVHLQTYITGLITKFYEHVGLVEVTDEGHVMSLSRAAVVTWACRMEVPSCTDAAITGLQEWMATDGVNTFKPDVKSAMYCTAIRHGGKEEWDFMRLQYDYAITSASESTILIAALGCSTDPATLKQYLSDSILPNSTIRKQDMRSVYASVYSNPAGVDPAVDFLDEEFEAVSAVYGGLNAMGSLMSGIATNVKTQEQRTKMERIMEQHSIILGASVTANANSIMTETFAWQEAHSEEIINWMKMELGMTTTTTTTMTSTTTVPPTTPSGAASLSYCSALLLLVAMRMCIVM